ncbi:hypothetical protein [Desulforhopalus singaporensis]|uniref:hypothetical protein n=1 Tax=Desulforhopalus singaporensis TaxID=91360 RepID=UPI00115FEA9C|nr:hypothetical protein [Desulforhopalus singaporensis]
MTPLNREGKTVLQLSDSYLETAVQIEAEILKRRKQLSLETLIEDLKTILSNAWKKSIKDLLIRTLRLLQSMTGPVTRDELLFIEENVSDGLKMPLDEAKRAQLIDIQEALFSIGAGEAAKGTGVKIVWNLADQKTLKVLDTNLMFWIGSYYDDNLSEGFKATLQDFFEGGYNRKDLAELMKVHFRELGTKPDHYWNLLADHTATKTREIGRVSGYEQAGIKTVRIKAHLDEKTTEVCRRMHDQVIEVTYLNRQMDKYLAACETKDKEKIKASWPWISDAQAERSLASSKGIKRQIKRGKIGLPPYHARCRTITVAEF